jgi:hypothetical protein
VAGESRKVGLDIGVQIGALVNRRRRDKDKQSVFLARR